MDTSRNQVVLKMIPRIDYTRKRGVLRSSDDESRKRKRRRPPTKLFDPDAIRCHNVDIKLVNGNEETCLCDFIQVCALI